MWWRVLLAATAVTCTLSRSRAVGPQHVALKKDLLCVLILSGIQKEDLDENTLQKLQRRNVNIDDLNNEEVRSKCEALLLPANNLMNTTNETESTDNEKNVQTEANYKDYVNHNDNENKTEDGYFNQQEFNKKQSPAIVIKNSKENNTPPTYNCNNIIKYKDGQPDLKSMLEFWKNCVNVKKTSGNYGYKVNQNPMINSENSFKIKQKNKLGASSNINFRKSDHIQQTTLEQKSIQALKQFSPNRRDANYQLSVDNLQQFSPSVEYNNIKNMKNELKNLKLNNQNNKHPNSKLEDILMQTLYTMLNNYKTQTLGRNDQKERSKINGDSYLNSDTYFLDKKEQVPNNNFLLSDNLPNNNSYRRGFIQEVQESPKIIPNFDLPNKEFFYPKNEPQKDLQIRESKNLADSMNVRDDNVLYPVKKPNADSEYPGYGITFLPYGRKVIPINDSSYETATATLKNNYWYNMPNNDPHTGLLQNTDELPAAIQTTASKNVHYSGNEPQQFNVNYLPLLISNVTDTNPLYPLSEPRKFIFQSESASVDDKSKIIPNINRGLSEHDKNSIHNDSQHRDSTFNSNMFKNDYYKSELNQYNITSYSNPENSYRTNLPYKQKSNFSYRGISNENLNTNNNINNINLPTTNTPIADSKYYYTENRPNKYLQSKESSNNQFFYQTNGPNVHFFNAGKVNMENVSKNIPQVTSSTFVKNAIIPNNLLQPTDKHYISSKLVNTLTMPALYKNEPVIEDKISETISSITDETKANEVLMKKESVKESLTKTIPKNIIIDIVESVKQILLKDLKKEFSTVSTSIATTATTTTTPSTPPTTTTQKIAVDRQTVAGHTQNYNKLNESAIQDAVIDKVMKLLAKMNILKNNPLNINRENLPPNDSNTLLERKLTTSTSTMTTTTVKLIYQESPTNKPVAALADNSDSNSSPQFQNREVEEKIEIVTTPQKLVKPKPITYQTNLFEIQPLGVYMDRYLDPINQNIILTTTRSIITNIETERAKSNIHQNLKWLENISTYSDKLRQMEMKHKTAYNLNTNKELNAAIRGTLAQYSNNEDDNVGKYKPYTEAHQNNAPSYYRPVNTDVNINAHDPALILDREKCCERQYVSQLMRDCCNERVTSRKQVSISSTRNRSLNSRFQSLIQSHHKVNSMLESMLAARHRFPSVESI